LNLFFGQASFWLHRITGVLLAVYIFPHILLNSIALFFGPETYDRLLDMVQGPAFHYLEIAIVLGVAFHMFNGLRLIFADFLETTRYQKLMLFFASFLTFVVFCYSLLIYVPKMLHGE
jgi:succinate dehydrogenase / fumarate reductase cytochrome b subunit